MASLFARLTEQAALRVATRAQGIIVAAFDAAEANAPTRAIAYVPESKIGARAFDRMVAFGAIVAEGERYWLDRRALANFRKEELARVLGAIAVAGFAAAGAIALGR